ncbi:MAG: hypothetical protein AB1465_06440 [Patescibacteria group bacterium]
MTKSCFSFLVFLMILFFSCGGKKEKDNIISSESVNEVNNLLDFARQDFEKYESSGYSFDEAVAQTISDLKNKSGVVDVGLGEDSTTIWFSHSSGIIGSYLTSVQSDLESAEMPLEFQKSYLSFGFAGYAAIFEAPAYFNLDLDAKIKSLLEGAGYVVDYFQDEKFTLDQLRNLGKYSIIYIMAHGGISLGQFHFVTGEKVDDLEQAILRFAKADAGLGIGSYEGALGNFYMVCPRFFEVQQINFSAPSLMYMSSCHSLQVYSLAETLRSLGLNVYLGWNEWVSTKDEYVHTVPCFFEKIAAAKTIDEAFSECETEDSKFGISDGYDKKQKKQIHAELEYYPSWAGDFRLGTEESKGKIGDPCKSKGDCQSENCFSGPDGWPGGYCLQHCFGNADCPDESWCAMVNPYFLVEGEYSGECFRKCYQDFDCRGGYFCASIDNENFGVCIPNYHDGPECGKVFEKLEAWNCAPGLECIHIYSAPFDLGMCRQVCNPLNPNCDNCFSEINYSLDGRMFCGICCDNCSYKQFEELCGPSSQYKDLCPQGTDCFGYEGGEFRCYALCDLSAPNCPAGRDCFEIQDYCQGIGGCMPE